MQTSLFRPVEMSPDTGLVQACSLHCTRRVMCQIAAVRTGAWPVDLGVTFKLSWQAILL